MKRASINTGDLHSRCEVAMMGMAVEIHSDDEAREAFKYIKNALGYEKFYNDVDIINDRLNPKNRRGHFTVCNLITYTIWNMPCICFCCSYADEKGKVTERPFTSKWGNGITSAFSYVFNLAGDETCSEFGDVFFKKVNGVYKLAR